ncbi:hypothetical protein OAP18_01420 [Gammaproteobacteria bacterium]|nr:hypothetical protein [Gammaproteobacteria bacterium]
MEFFEQTEHAELLGYAIFGLLLASIPVLMRLFSFDMELSDTKALKAFGNGGSLELLSKYGKYLAFPFAALIFWSFIRPDWSDHWFFVVMSMAMTALILWGLSNSVSKESNNKPILFILVGFTALLAAAFNFSTNYFSVVGASIMDPAKLWHHWGAYISAAKSLDAGLAIYNEFPSQYGFGPSLIIALFSHMFGWVTGTFYAIGLLQFLHWATITVIGFNLIKRMQGEKYIIWAFVLLVTFSSCFFWFPQSAYYANITPSLGGARYLPGPFFVAVLLSLNLSTQNLTPKKIWIMHGLWAACFLWSIESAFYVCLIWWPYYIYIRSPKNGNLGARVRRFFKSVFELLLVAAAVLLIILAVYWLVYGVFPIAGAYTVFVDNVPGALLIDFSGAIIFIITMFVIGLCCMILAYKKYGESPEFHYLFAVLLLAYAAFSYFIGRSHDYNIRPLVPYFSLILLAMTPVIFSRFVQYMSVAVLSLFVTWVSIEQYNLGFKWMNFEGGKLEAQFLSYREDPNNSDLGRAIAYVSENYNEPVIAVDPLSSVTISGNQEQWNAFNNMASYFYLPSPMQKEFVYRSKNKLMRIGWVVVHRDMGPYGNPYILDLFDASYEVEDGIMFGEYEAFRFLPKQN